MSKIKVLHYDAFTTIPNKGNPAGIVLDMESLSEKDMQELARFPEMVPHNEQFPEILTENPKASLHPYCFETVDPQAFMHARHYSSVYSGIVEDPATGTASGVLGAYYLTYIHPELQQVDFVVEQGLEMERDSRIHVYASKDEHQAIEVSISGTAVRVGEITVEYGILLS